MSLGSDGNFYGTTATTIFRVSPLGTFKVLFTFPCSRTTCPSGMDARVPPNSGHQRELYGTTADGGIKESGVVYELPPQATTACSHKFLLAGELYRWDTPNRTGAGRERELFYGIAANGGASGKNGTLFKITPAKQFIVLHTFESGVVPWSLTIANDGNMYGTTLLDRASGTFGKDIFQVAPKACTPPPPIHPGRIARTVPGNGRDSLWHDYKWWRAAGLRRSLQFLP